MHEPTPPTFKCARAGLASSIVTVWLARRARCFVFLFLLLALPGSAGAQQMGVDLYTAEHEKRPQVDQFYTQRFREDARRQQEQFRTRVAIPEAVSDDVPTLTAIAEAKAITTAAKAHQTPPWQGWCIFGLAVLVGVLVVYRLFPQLSDWLRELFTPWEWEARRGGVLANEDSVRVEAQAFSDFIAAFRAGPALRAESEPQVPLDDFLARAPKILEDLRRQLVEAGQTTDPKARRRLLYDLSREMRGLKGETGIPELLPAWQMVCALEGLLKQLGDKVNEVTASTLRTVAGGVDLLGELCRPGLDAQLLSRRAVRLLAVDDDPISRHAISFALKRTLHAPDLANDGEAGLALAQQTSYDVIFLDVEMPGMDGFELCTQIHKTRPNPATPVVFVTNQSDFEARVQSTLSGGYDLIAKPFLTFELAVKALTLAIQNRLRETKASSGAAVLSNGVVRPVEKRVADSAGDATDTGPVGVPTEPPAADSVEIATEFLKRAPEHLDWVNELLHDALKLTDENAWSQTLADVYLRLHAFTPEGVFTKGHPALQLSVALDRLLRKLLQNPAPPTKGTMMTVTAGVELLQELCADRAGATRPHAPVHILVVDDDPVARRALTGVLQTTFEKPVCAENGAVALALAADRVFDVIFLDVQMPGMDGIEVFARLRGEGGNMATPVIFVSGRNDIGSAVEVNASGDCDVVVKPFFPGELLVKALTLVLRHRREQSVVLA